MTDILPFQISKNTAIESAAPESPKVSKVKLRTKAPSHFTSFSHQQSHQPTCQSNTSTELITDQSILEQGQNFLQGLPFFAWNFHCRILSLTGLTYSIPPIVHGSVQLQMRFNATINNAIELTFSIVRGETSIIHLMKIKP